MLRSQNRNDEEYEAEAGPTAMRGSDDMLPPHHPEHTFSSDQGSQTGLGKQITALVHAMSSSNCTPS